MLIGFPTLKYQLSNTSFEKDSHAALTLFWTFFPAQVNLNKRLFCIQYVFIMLPSFRFKTCFLLFDISDSKLLGIFQFMKFFTFCFDLEWILVENINFSSGSPQKSSN